MCCLLVCLCEGTTLAERVQSMCIAAWEYYRVKCRPCALIKTSASQILDEWEWVYFIFVYLTNKLLVDVLRLPVCYVSVDHALHDNVHFCFRTLMA